MIGNIGEGWRGVERGGRDGSDWEQWEGWGMIWNIGLGMIGNIGEGWE